MSKKKTSKGKQTFKLTSKKDFGLGEYRFSLPDNEVRILVSQEDTCEDKPKKNRRLSGMGGRVKRLLKKPQPQDSLTPEGFRPKRGHAPSYRVGPDYFDDDTSSLSSSGRPSPSLHSRMIKRGLLDATGIKGSLENLEDYGRKKKERIEKAVGMLIVERLRCHLILKCFSWSELGECIRLTFVSPGDTTGM